MNRFWLCVSVFALLAGLPAPSIAEELPLKRVTLSTSGLAQFEHQGQVRGDREISLPVRLDQVDDVLKSLVVLDRAGSFGGVTLPGREPLSQIFRDLPFDQNALQSPQTLLQALQGTEVKIAGPNPISGKLVSVTPETQITKDGVQSTKHRVAIMADDGLHTFLLEDLSSLQWTDPTVQDQLNRALTALHGHRIQDQRVLTLNLRGEGDRPVTISYVAGAPLWKSAYRLILPENQSGKAYLQGWAILENTTGQDWDDVSVTLLSGNPVTYQQSLYESYYRDRPFLPLRVMDQLMPRTDLGGVEMAQLAGQNFGEATGGAPRKAVNSRAIPAAPAMASLQSMEMMSDSAVSSPPMPMANAETAITEQALAKMAFHFPQKVTLLAGNSMMLPVIARDISAEQLWLYQPETNARHPLAAVAIHNDSPSSLPNGILTLFEQTENGLLYSGDSELALLPKDEKRYVTFALDPATLIDREVGHDRLYGTITAAKGIIRQKVVSTEMTSYTIKAPADEARIIVIEHPRRNGWELRVPDGLKEKIEKTETHYRLKLALKPGETQSFKITLERSDFEAISIAQFSPDQLSARLAAMGTEIDAKTKKALEGAMALQQDVFALDQQIQTLDEERQAIFNNQNRIRGNLGSIPSGSDLAKNYLTELSAQEDRLKKIEADQSLLRQKNIAAKSKLDDYVAGLNL